MRSLTEITITPKAQEYLVELLAKHETPGMNIRIFIDSPGTPMAETCVSYCAQGEQQDDDEQIQLDGFVAWLDHRSLPFLNDAIVDYQEDRMGGQLTVRAPNSRVPQVSPDSSLEDRINYVLHAEINPSLAAHGGMVMLERIEEDGDKRVAVLRFGGGCQGCSMVDMTLKSSVESTLLERIEDLTGVADVTDHSDRSQAYYA